MAYLYTKKGLNNSNLISINDTDILTALEEFVNNYKKIRQIQQIPITIFSNKKLGVLEAIVKYLKENQELSFKEIAEILQRDQRTIWTTYNKAVKKQKEKFSTKKEQEYITIKSFSNTKYSPLQALIKELEAKGYTLSKIAKLTNRSYKNIWMTKKNEQKITI